MSRAFPVVPNRDLAFDGFGLDNASFFAPSTSELQSLQTRNHVQQQQQSKPYQILSLSEQHTPLKKQSINDNQQMSSRSFSSDIANNQTLQKTQRVRRMPNGRSNHASSNRPSSAHMKRRSNSALTPQSTGTRRRKTTRNPKSSHNRNRSLNGRSSSARSFKRGSGMNTPPPFGNATASHHSHRKAGKSSHRKNSSYNHHNQTSSQDGNFKVVVRVRPPLPRELNSPLGFAHIVRVDTNCKSIAISDGFATNLASMNDLSTTFQSRSDQQHAGLDSTSVDYNNYGNRSVADTPMSHVSAASAATSMIQTPMNANWMYNVHKFTFDYVYNEAAQQENVYNTTAQEAVMSTLTGYNASIIAYGQTSAGKTYTMEGFDSDQLRGIIPRSIEEIFRYIQQKASPTMRFLVRASYLQIYNEVISDLLKSDRNNLQIREDKKRGLYVSGLSEWVVRSPAEIYGLIKRGASVRATCETRLNEISSRSHAIFIIIVEQNEITLDDENLTNSPSALAAAMSNSSQADLAKNLRQNFKVGKLNLVDLAGSERVEY